MNASELDSALPRKARVEIIPLIDVIFFLLATFVLFTLSLDRLRSVEADLPKGGIESPPDPGTVFIQASAGGIYFWKLGSDGATESITAPELGPRLAEYRNRTHTPRVMVRSDGQARLGDAVVILDEVRRAGIKEVAVETTVSRSGM